MSRLPLRDPDELPELDEYDAAEGIPEEYRDARHFSENRFQNSRVWRTMANNPAIHELHTEAALTLWKEETTGLTPRENELLILSCGRAFEAVHEWNSHVQNALTMGITEDEILALAAGDFDALDDADAALARYVTAVATMSVTDDLHDELAEHYDDSAIVGIQVLAGFYALCAVVIEAMGVETADPGEGLEHLAYERLLA